MGVWDLVLECIPTYIGMHMPDLCFIIYGLDVHWETEYIVLVVYNAQSWLLWPTGDKPLFDKSDLEKGI